MDNDVITMVWSEAVHAAKYYFIFAGIAFVIFYAILKRPLGYRKIQAMSPKPTDYAREVILSLVSVGIFGVVAALTFGVFGQYTNVYGGAYDRYGQVYYLFTFIWAILLHDTYFYWMHRFMHTRFIYRLCHRVHHRSTNPNPWTAYSFHPVEAVLEAGILPLMAFTLPIHPSVIMSVFIFQILYNVYGHLGFELYPREFHRTRIGKYINTAVAHNLHHSHFTGNYGLYFLFWDRWMGTLRQDYDSNYERTTLPRLNKR